MTNSEIDITEDLALIHGRLQRSRAFGEMMFNQGITHDPELVRFINETDSTRLLRHAQPRTARSDNLVSSDNIRHLNQKIDSLRLWLFSKNQSGRSHPDYPEWVEQNVHTRSEMEKHYWYKSQIFYLSCDKEQPTNSSDADKLWFFTNLILYYLQHMEVIFDFKDNFNLLLGFGGKPPLIYEVNGKLATMTLQEFQIISFFLQRFENTQTK